MRRRIRETTILYYTVDVCWPKSIPRNERMVVAVRCIISVACIFEHIWHNNIIMVTGSVNGNAVSGPICIVSYREEVEVGVG